MKNVKNDIKRLSRVCDVVACLCAKSTVIQTPWHASQGDQECAEEGPDATCDDIDSNNSANKWTAIKAIENEGNADLNSAGDDEADDTHRKVVLEVVLIMQR